METMQKSSKYSNDEQLNSALAIEFICPECRSHMHPPIYQCKQGHSVCKHCKEAVENCPECRVSMARHLTRNYNLEHLHDKLIFPCRFYRRGCGARLRGNVIEAHEDHCAFGVIPCPFRRYQQCYWIGKPSDLLTHAAKYHKYNLIQSRFHRMNCRVFNPHVEQGFTYTVAVFYSRYEYFKFISQIDHKSGLIRIGVFQLILNGRRSSSENYEFRFRIESATGSEIYLSQTSVCHQMDIGQPIPFDNYQYVILHMDLIKKHIDDISYTVQINDRDVQQDPYLNH